MVEPLNDPRSHACLLLLEVGNSHISVASWVVGAVRTHDRFALDELDQAVSRAREVWDALPENRLKAIAAASVVPKVMAALEQRITDEIGQPVHVVGDDLHRPMSLAVEEPEKVGIDRVCSAAAAYDAMRKACTIASFGTAITIDCVNNEGAFLGGAILPGLGLQARSLAGGTAALPEVTIEATKTVYGASTHDAICNGVLYGVVGALREITERYATELGSWPDLIVTGGNAELVGSECEFIDRIVPDLCLRGIALAYRRHFDPLSETEPAAQSDSEPDSESDFE